MNASPTLTITKDFTKEFNETIKRFRKDAVLVGIPEEKSNREDEDQEIGNAAILAINHFGSEEARIPPRPVLAIGIKNAQEKIAETIPASEPAKAWGPDTISVRADHETASQSDQAQIQHPAVPEVVQVEASASETVTSPDQRTVLADHLEPAEKPAVQIGVDGPGVTLAELREAVARIKGNPRVPDAAAEPLESVSLPRCAHKELCEDGEWYGCRLGAGHKGKCVRGERIDV